MAITYIWKNNPITGQFKIQTMNITFVEAELIVRALKSLRGDRPLS